MWPRRQQPQVRADLPQATRAGLQNAAHLDKSVGILRGLNKIFSPGQSQTGDLAKMFDDAEAEVLAVIESEDSRKVVCGTADG